jgi:hypothetical protein
MPISPAPQFFPIESFKTPRRAGSTTTAGEDFASTTYSRPRRPRPQERDTKRAITMSPSYIKMLAFPDLDHVEQPSTFQLKVKRLQFPRSVPYYD